MILFRWSLATLLEWGVIVAAFLAVGHWHTLFVFWLASLVIGNRIHALGVLGHEGIHANITGNRRLDAALVSVAVYWPAGVSFPQMRLIHMTHHRAIGTPDDPELRLWPGRADYRITRWGMVSGFVLDLLGRGAVRQMPMFFEQLHPRTAREAIGPIVFGVLPWIVCLWFGAWWAPLLWGFSFATSFWATYWIRSLFEHAGTTGTHRVEVGWLTRVLFMPHNTDMHYEHHDNPGVPWLALSALRRSMPIPPVSRSHDLFGRANC